MFVAKFKGKIPDKKYFRVFESYREGPKVKKRHIIYLGTHPTVELSYQQALKDSLRASDKLERLEYVMLSMQEKGA